MFELEYEAAVPAAYISFTDEPTPSSAKQMIVEISELNFVPHELIFDLDADGRVIGVEIL